MFSRLARLQRATPGDSGSCGGDTVGVQVPPFACSKIAGLAPRSRCLDVEIGRSMSAKYDVNALERRHVTSRAYDFFGPIDGMAGVVPRCVSRYAATRAAASACTASRVVW